MQKRSYRAPIAFFAYKRPTHTLRSLESLARNREASESELFVFCDASRTDSEVDQVEEVRRIVRQRRWCKKVNITEQSENLGLASSIIRGVTDLVERYGRVIVLEDDLILSPYFLQYMNLALDLYEGDPKAMHIAGYMFPIEIRGQSDSFFLRLATCWGWGTWRESWRKFNPNSSFLLKEIQRFGLARSFDIDGVADFYKMLRLQVAGEIDSWAIRWYASVFLNKGLGLHPRRSLVENIGFDGTGEHCGKVLEYSSKSLADNLFISRQEVRENANAIGTVRSYFRNMNSYRSKVRRKCHALLRKCGRIVN